MDRYICLRILSYNLPLSQEVIETLRKEDKISIARMFLFSTEDISLQEADQILSFHYLNSTIKDAIKLSNLPLIKKLWNSTYPQDLFDTACQNSTLKVITYLLDNLELDPTTALFIAYSSPFSYDLIQILHKKGGNLSRSMIFHHLIENSKHREVRYLLDNETEPYYITRYTASMAAARGYLDVLQYLDSKGILLQPEQLQYACLQGHLHVVEYLDSKGLNLRNETAIQWALSQNHLNVIKYLLQRGVPISLFHLRSLLLNGEYDILPTFDYLLSQGAMYIHENEDFLYCNSAVQKRLLDCLHEKQRQQQKDR